MKKVAVCFFGIIRSLEYNFDSIERNILDPARRLGEVTIYTHIYNLREVHNFRSGEKGKTDFDRYDMLRSDWLEIEEPGLCLEKWNFSQVSLMGDAWGDGYSSLKNLIHQLNSLHAVTAAAVAGGADVFVFARPDLMYHDSLERHISYALRRMSNVILLPKWQEYGGYNDRFSICCGMQAAMTYGFRIEKIERFCEIYGAVHSERLLKFAIDSGHIGIKRISSRATRVRVGGVLERENFQGPFVVAVRRRIPFLERVFRISGLSIVLRNILGSRR